MSTNSKNLESQTYKKSKLSNNSQKKDIYECKYCNKRLSTNSNYIRHIKQYCKQRRLIEEEKEHIYKQLLEKLEAVEKENIAIKAQLALLTNKTNNKIKNYNNIQNNIENSNVNSNNNTFVLVGCGKENIIKIDKQKLVKAVSNGFYSTYRLTDIIHFNPDHPEYRWTKFLILSIDFMKQCFIKP